MIYLTLFIEFFKIGLFFYWRRNGNRTFFDGTDPKIFMVYHNRTGKYDSN